MMEIEVSFNNMDGVSYGSSSGFVRIPSCLWGTGDMNPQLQNARDTLIKFDAVTGQLNFVWNNWGPYQSRTYRINTVQYATGTCSMRHSGVQLLGEPGAVNMMSNR